MSSLEIFDSFNQTSYSEQQRQIIIDIILNCFSDKKSSIYLYQQTNQWGKGETIFLIHCELPVLFQRKIYDVSMNIFLPNGFPSEAPEIYFQSKPLLAINPNYFKKVIDPINLKFNLDSIGKWDPNRVNFEALFQNMQEMFSNDFPLNKVKQSQKIFIGKCSIDLTQQQKVSVGFNNSYSGSNSDIKPNYNNNSESSIVINNQSYFSPIKSTNGPMSHNQGQFFVSPLIKNEIKVPTEFTEEDIKILLQKEIEVKLKGIVFDQLAQLHQDRDQLNNLKNYYKEKVKYDPDQSKLSIAYSELDNLKHTYKIQDSNLKEACAMLESSASKGLNVEDILDIVDIRPLKSLKASCIYFTLEEHILLVKKAFEKGKVSFEDSIKEIRRTSRDIFNIHRYKEFLIRKYSE